MLTVNDAVSLHQAAAATHLILKGEFDKEISRLVSLRKELDERYGALAAPEAAARIREDATAQAQKLLSDAERINTIAEQSRARSESYEADLKATQAKLDAALLSIREKETTLDKEHTDTKEYFALQHRELDEKRQTLIRDEAEVASQREKLFNERQAMARRRA